MEKQKSEGNNKKAGSVKKRIHTHQTQRMGDETGRMYSYQYFPRIQVSFDRNSKQVVSKKTEYK